MVYCFVIISVFLSGMLCGINLTGLLTINSDYEYAWWKVIVTVLFAMFCGAVAFCEASLISRRTQNR